MNGIEITKLPHTGTLFLNDIPLSSRDSSDPLRLTSDQISQLHFMPKPDESGSGYDLFSFKVFDQGGLMSLEETITFNVLPVADLVDIVASDNVVNRSEKAAGVTLSGTAEGADFVFVDWGGVERLRPFRMVFGLHIFQLFLMSLLTWVIFRLLAFPR